MVVEKRGNYAGKERQTEPPGPPPADPDGQELSDESLDGVTGGSSNVLKIRHDVIKNTLGNIR